MGKIPTHTQKHGSIYFCTLFFSRELEFFSQKIDLKRILIKYFFSHPQTTNSSDLKKQSFFLSVLGFQNERNTGTNILTSRKTQQSNKNKKNKMMKSIIFVSCRSTSSPSPCHLRCEHEKFCEPIAYESNGQHENQS